MNNYHHRENLDLDQADCSTESSSWSEVFCPKVKKCNFKIYLTTEYTRKLFQNHQEELGDNLKPPLVFNPKRTSSQAGEFKEILSTKRIAFYFLLLSGLTRSLDECVKFAKDHGYDTLTDEELVMMVRQVSFAVKGI